MIAYRNDEMTKAYEDFGEIFFVDGTYQVNRNKYSLYFFSVKDAYGKSRVVFEALTAYERQSCLDVIVEALTQRNNVLVTHVIMVDKDLVEVEALEVGFIFL